MKVNNYMFKSIILSLCMLTAANASTSTMLEQTTTNIIKQSSIATNLNEVIIDILRGVKSAGGEVYQASKKAITKSVDFTMEQAPLIVNEFLHWKLAEAIIRMSCWLFTAGVVFLLAHILRKDISDNDELVMAVWLMRMAGIFIVCLSVYLNAMTITKISIAPRVYLIEYVVDTMQGNNNHR